MKKDDRITINPLQCGGLPCVRGMHPGERRAGSLGDRTVAGSGCKRIAGLGTGGRGGVLRYAS